jgi:hypothetical protein
MKHRNTETQKHRNTETQKHRGTEAQRHRGTEAQRHRGTKAQRWGVWEEFEYPISNTEYPTDEGKAGGSAGVRKFEGRI